MNRVWVSGQQNHHGQTTRFRWSYSLEEGYLAGRFRLGGPPQYEGYTAITVFPAHAT